MANNEMRIIQQQQRVRRAKTLSKIVQEENLSQFSNRARKMPTSVPVHANYSHDD